MGFNVHTETKCFDASERVHNPDDIFSADGWKETTVEIQVPTREKCPEGNGKPFLIKGLMYRPLMSVIQAGFSEAMSGWFHLTPFKQIWKSPDDDCPLERVIAGLMFWSDSTHLAQFGNASAWPIYSFFGNLSKYKRASPNTGPCHPVAFIPSITHCKRELVHAVWRILLDDDFVKAYKDGIVIKCYDGVVCRVYPRIFMYSADYPEKILIATIRDKGICPCPRCLVPKSSFGRLGLFTDIVMRLSKARTYLRSKIISARHAIYQLGVPIKGNTFAERLAPLNFNVFPTLVVDLMHEFELGVLKSAFKHLIRILYAIDPGLVAILNERYGVFSESVPSP
ncbi:hypothetical protein PAXRUDRAFT_784545 [Paxillus rubicundulus Ve08.2h10]|uniref:Uncharacterized protein n=1 Tax=Paxillus rubicundulus Ve08.2h10 TaxID=930991 RepID=A0A0D0DE84_9AGAM|nr:hypothetical protein PAXRUDRAFT_784545 [Paxillus rubicundulus Ve08.2h10]